jgi:hypothetical protein
MRRLIDTRHGVGVMSRCGTRWLWLRSICLLSLAEEQHPADEAPPPDTGIDSTIDTPARPRSSVLLRSSVAVWVPCGAGDRHSWQERPFARHSHTTVRKLSSVAMTRQSLLAVVV